MLYTALCTFNAMLQCLTQLIILQTSIRFQQQQPAPDHGGTLFSANHPSLRWLTELACDHRYVGAFIVLCSQSVHSDHWPCTDPWALMQGVAGASLVPAAPVSLTLTSAHPRQCTKQIPTRHKGQKYLFTVNTFFRCTMSVLNVQYLWHRIVHVVSKVSLDPEVIEIILLECHKVSHLPASRKL